MKVAHSPEPAEERVVFRDGLGVRERRATPGGEAVEWFHLVAEFSAAEALLRERVTRLVKFQHVKFSRILGLEPAGKGTGPILVSSHLAGTRLADVLEMAGHGLVTFDAGAGLHVTREVLGGLAVLHDSRTVSHGSLAPERIVLTPNGRVVMVEHVLGPAIDRLQRPRHQLWREWRIPTPPGSGQVKLDMQADLAQAGLVAIAALLGRPVDEEEYPHRLRGLLPLIQDRLARSQAAGVAGDVVAWLERLAPLDSRRAFKSVKEAQQAYEAIVAGNATAMGITSSRVKGILAAVAGLAAPTPAPTAPAPTAHDQASTTPAAPIVVHAPVAPLGAGPRAEEPEIDIEALLRLEAELEGGSAPVPDPVARAIAATTVEAAAPSLEDLARERAALQQQFASLVAAVAPVDDGPAHLIPETPLTSEPLVDERVRWSSMPADDLTETLDVPAPVDPEVERPAAVSIVEAPVLVADAPTDDVVLVETPVAETPLASTDDATEPAAESVTGPVSGEAGDLETVVLESAPPQVDDLPPFVVEPIVVIAPEEPAPSAAIEHVPADWWKEALPWRDEDHAAAEDMAPMGPLEAASKPEADAAVTPDLFAPVVDAPALAEVPDAFALAEVPDAFAAAMPEVAVPVEPDAVTAVDVPQVVDEDVPAEAPGVGHDFGYLSLDAIEARAVRINEGQVEDALATADPESDEPPAVVYDASAPFAFVGDEPATLEFSAELLDDEAPVSLPVDEPAGALDAEVAALDEPHTHVALVGEAVEDDAPDVDDAPPSSSAHAEPDSSVAEEFRPPSMEAPSSPEGRDDAPASPATANLDMSAPADVSERDPYAQPSSGGFFGELRPIMLQELEPAADDDQRAAAESPFADAAPREAASSLFARAESQNQVVDWRQSFVDAGESSEPAHVQACAPAVVEVPIEVAVDASPWPVPHVATGDPEPLPEPVVAVDVAVPSVVSEESLPASLDEPQVDVVATPEAGQAEVEVGEVVTAPPLAGEHALDAAEVAPEQESAPEVVVVDGGADGHAWDQLTSEVPAPVHAELVHEADAGDDDDVAATAMAPDAADAAGTTASKRKRRRSRRKKAATVITPAPLETVVESPAPPEPATVPVASPAAVPLVIAPVLPPDEDDPAQAKEQLRAAVSARSTSLLEREVPTWTPPADLAVMRPRVVQPTAREMAAPPPPPVSDVPPAASADDWGTGSFPATTMVSGEVVIPTRPVSPTTPVAMPAPTPVAPVLELGPADGSRAFDDEIRPVGMPDLTDLEPRMGRGGLTTPGEALGPSSSARQAEPRMVPMSAPEVSRGMNWRRLMAAAALIALFNGAAFAAWWWVHPGARGTLVVETGRAGVEVLLDQTVMGRTPFRGEVQPGRHTLSLRQGNTVRNMPVEISAGVVTTQSVDWPPGGAGGHGALQVNSTPTGAELLVNGKARGKTPLLLEDLPEGDLELTVRSEAGIVTTTATVVAGETTPVDVKVFAGWVLVDSEYEVDLLLNGKKIGTSLDGQILLPPGPYRLKAVNRSFGIDQVLTFAVEPGDVTRLSLKVSPAWFDAPEGTEVIVDGTSVGTGPGRVSILPGTHDVVVRAADGSERQFSGIVKASRAFEP